MSIIRRKLHIIDMHQGSAGHGGRATQEETRMYSLGLAMRMRPGAYAEYKRAHDELWPAVAQSMSDNQVSMAIYRYGESLVIHAVAPTEEDWLKSREVPILEEWMAYMATLIETDANGDVDFEELEEAFSFGLFRRD